MESNNQYNPLNDTVNTVISGLLPGLIVGLFNGFESAKRRGFSSPINVFDDIIIFYSIIIYPLVSGLQCISFSRLVAHFGEAPENINTVISYYLNYHEGLKIDPTKVQRNEIFDDVLKNLKKVKDLL
ncbi:4330_t:CDS:2 [Dentiscutata heterogama]|uniref:4330_t:CDS:1 n=1 Tax=Dentiscutata heterogama TaxID=1316150 RepID=A0ACA9L471_9GLOM|nr:4330_t:CDS:2 [Dentiscutata heterogama]